MNDYERTATAIRQANPWAEGATAAEGEWPTAELLSRIEHRSVTVKTIERENRTQPSGPKRNRGWLLAAVAALVVLIGAVVFGLTRDAGTDVVEPTPTTLSAPTTLPTPTTLSAPTTLPTPTTLPPPATTTPVTTAVVPAQAYDATLTWDGETCSFEGPAEARAGDTLNLTGVNLDENTGYFLILYMVTGTTIEDVNDHFDNVLGNFLPFPAGTAGWSYPTALQRSISPPAEYALVREHDGILAGASANILADGGPGGVVLRQPREHFFVCSSSVTAGAGRIADRIIDNAPQTIVVSE